MPHRARLMPVLLMFAAIVPASRGWATSQDDPPALNPFGAAATAGTRPDAIPGTVELSDGSRLEGRIYLTRDARLRIFDATTKRVREVPLSAVRRVDCVVTKEWLEPEWRFAANASDKKVYTGRSYPSRTYSHAITLKDGRTLTGPLSGIVYVKAVEVPEARRFLLHDRDKGEMGQGLKDLIYVKTIELVPPGEERSKPSTAPDPAPGD